MTAIPTAPLAAPAAAIQHRPHVLGAIRMKDGTEYDVSIIYRDDQGQIIDLAHDHNLCVFIEDPSAKELVKTRLQMIAEAHATAKGKEFKDIQSISIKDEGIAFDSDARIDHELAVSKDLNDQHRTAYTKVASIWESAKEKIEEDYNYHMLHANEPSLTMPVSLKINKANVEASLNRPAAKDAPLLPPPALNLDGTPNNSAPKAQAPDAIDPKLAPTTRDLTKAVNVAAKKPEDSPVKAPTKLDEEQEKKNTPEKEEQAAPQSYWKAYAAAAVQEAKEWLNPSPPKPYEFTEAAASYTLDDIRVEFKTLLTETKLVVKDEANKDKKAAIVDHFFRIQEKHENGYDKYYEESNPFHPVADKVQDYLKALQNKTPAQVIEIFSAFKADAERYQDTSTRADVNKQQFIAFITHIIETELEQYIKGYLLKDALGINEKEKISLKKLHRLVELAQEKGLLTTLDLPKLAEFLQSSEKGSLNKTSLYRGFIEPIIVEIRKNQGHAVRFPGNEWKNYLTAS